MANNILGIDYGARRIGLALANTETRLAAPYDTLASGADLVSKILEIIADEAIDEVVVGLPRNLDGEDTPQTVLVRRFAAELADRSKLPVHLQDEALTSEEAKRQLLEQSHGSSVSRQLIDQVAASIILQDYLGSL